MDIFECQACPAGMISVAGMPECKVCPDLGMMPNAEKTACEWCDSGYYAFHQDTQCMPYEDVFVEKIRVQIKFKGRHDKQEIYEALSVLPWVPDFEYLEDA
jgi:hypothetical protein